MEERKHHKPHVSSEVINLLLESIAKEELALANILYGEGEKIEAVIEQYNYHRDGKHVSLEKLLETNESVRKTIIATIKKEMLLEFKLENVIELIKLTKHHYPH
ncbi:hypothetical protein KHQ82_08940 [Mycoplasmatota bacterium]|nr:hypothetical protein KHQ82_08940 [Mycoplasmatota bacterium]